MKIRKFIECNKQNIIKWLGILLIGIGIIGMGVSLFPKNNDAVENSNKKHYLCIGVDTYEVMGEREPVFNSIGQADGLFLVTLDKTSPPKLSIILLASLRLKSVRLPVNTTLSPAKTPPKVFSCTSIFTPKESSVSISLIFSGFAKYWLMV